MFPTSSGRRNAHRCTWCKICPTTFRRDLNTAWPSVRGALRGAGSLVSSCSWYPLRSRGTRDATSSIFALAYHKHHRASDAALAALNCGMNRTSPYSKGNGSSKGKGDNGQSDKGKGAVFVRARTIRWAEHWRRQLEVNNDAELVDNNDEEPEQWMGRPRAIQRGLRYGDSLPSVCEGRGLGLRSRRRRRLSGLLGHLPLESHDRLRQPAGEGRDRRARG